MTKVAALSVLIGLQSQGYDIYIGRLKIYAFRSLEIQIHVSGKKLGWIPLESNAVISAKKGKQKVVDVFRNVVITDHAEAPILVNTEQINYTFDFEDEE